MRKSATFIALASAVLLIVCCGVLNPRLLRMRRGFQGAPLEALENTPPLMAFTTIVLGGFRGLIADTLWLRATRLQEEGRYFELVQLADWITKFEPHTTQTWAYHAWNMAYNVSRMMATPGERWRWVHNGIVLLRDEGLRYSPGDAGLYFELGWLYQHKIGGQWDSAHGYYKHRLATEFHELFGGPRPDYTADAPQLTERLRDEYRLDMGRMRALEARYGPLDWRLPETHALYWATRGRPLARPADERRLVRMRYQSMSALFFTGTLDFSPGDSRFSRTPAPDLLPGVIACYEDALEKTPGEGVNTAFAAFLEKAEIMLTDLQRDDLLSQIRELRGRYGELPENRD